MFRANGHQFKKGLCCAWCHQGHPRNRPEHFHHVTAASSSMVQRGRLRSPHIPTTLQTSPPPPPPQHHQLRTKCASTKCTSTKCTKCISTNCTTTDCAHQMHQPTPDNMTPRPSNCGPPPPPPPHTPTTPPICVQGHPRDWPQHFHHLTATTLQTPPPFSHNTPPTHTHTRPAPTHLRSGPPPPQATALSPRDNSQDPPPHPPTHTDQPTSRGTAVHKLQAAKTKPMPEKHTCIKCNSRNGPQHLHHVTAASSSSMMQRSRPATIRQRQLNTGGTCEHGHGTCNSSSSSGRCALNTRTCVQ
jgi:hypothetical protein